LLVNPLTRLWRRTVECVGHWIIDEQQLRPRPNAMLERTAHDERSAAVCAAIEIN